MSESNEFKAVHASFTIERTYPAPPSRVFRAFADQGVKRVWFAEGAGFEFIHFTLDFRVGGKETSSSRFRRDVPNGGPTAGSVIRNDTTYLDIVPDRRIVLAYTMAINDERISASLATFELFTDAGGTRLVFTEQATFFERGDGPGLREQGWRGLLDALGHVLTS